MQENEAWGNALLREQIAIRIGAAAEEIEEKWEVQGVQDSKRGHGCGAWRTFAADSESLRECRGLSESRLMMAIERCVMVKGRESSEGDGLHLEFGSN